MDKRSEYLRFAPEDATPGEICRLSSATAPIEAVVATERITQGADPDIALQTASYDMMERG